MAVDARIAAGTVRQRSLLHAATESGSTVVGWKAGLGAPAARASLGLSAPLVGFLSDTTRVAPGATVDVAGWTAPRAEAEIAVRIGVDLSGDATTHAVLDAVDALAPSIELVDLDPPPADPAEILAGNIYHRAWVTGAFVPVDGGFRSAGRIVTVDTPAEGTTTVEDLEALTGAAGEVLVEVARMAARIGRGLRAGDIVMLGSVITPRTIGPGVAFRVTLDGHAVEVSLG